mgnify:CR=1 FL=1
MKLKQFLFLSLVLLFSFCTSDDDEPKINDGYLFETSAKIVGYLPTYRFAIADQIKFCRLTHLNLSFANPDVDGNIQMTDVRNVMQIARAQNPNIKIFISIAGGGLTPSQGDYWANLIDNASN